MTYSFLRSWPPILLLLSIVSAVILPALLKVYRHHPRKTRNLLGLFWWFKLLLFQTGWFRYVLLDASVMLLRSLASQTSFGFRCVSRLLLTRAFSCLPLIGAGSFLTLYFSPLIREVSLLRRSFLLSTFL